MIAPCLRLEYIYRQIFSTEVSDEKTRTITSRTARTLSFY
ncbi:hypothetical protein VCR4J2_20039 [Vibrio coralliirubri]|nr:hypothetical protein VCR4J2_20039 [Vibrio coralliirubri]